MSDLSTIFSSLVRYHPATAAQPLPSPEPGITWLWSADGIYKRGVDQHLDLLIRVGNVTAEVPGLARLLPHVRWSSVPGRLPGAILSHVLEHARKAGKSDSGSLARPVEQQYFVTFEAGKLRVKVPPQDSSSTRIRYQAMSGALIDIHSHHSMAAYFSSTDDQDDTGLSVSAVIGTIFTNPKIVCRVNVHGHRQNVPALTLFDSLPGIEDKYADIND